MDKRLLYFKPNLEGRVSLDPKTIADGTPVLAISSLPDTESCPIFCVCRKGSDNKYFDCHFTYFSLKKGAACTFVDKTLPPTVHRSYRFSEHICAIGCDVSGIELGTTIEFFAMTDEEINILGSILNGFRLTWDMETLQLIDCDTHEVLSAAERPPQPTAPKPEYNPIVTREALLAMEGVRYNQDCPPHLAMYPDNRIGSVIIFKFTDIGDDIPNMIAILSPDNVVYLERPDSRTWANLLLAIGICYPDHNKQGSPIYNFVRQIPIQLTITETRKQ